jgi:hypothetical protein
MKTLRQQFTDAGGRLVPDGDGLKIQAALPPPPELLAAIRARRDLMLAFYQERAAIREFDGGAPRAEAEIEAALEAAAILDTEPQHQPEPVAFISAITDEDRELFELSQ